MEKSSPGRSIMPEYRALERIAKAASEFIKRYGAFEVWSTEDQRIGTELRNAVRDYEVMKQDAR